MSQPKQYQWRLLMTGFVLMTAVTALYACHKKKVEVSFQIAVRTSSGEPVDAAKVLLDGKELGVTDQHGQLNHAVGLEPGVRHRIEISKESDAYYFAPYYDGFEVMQSGGGTQKVPINATLYFVPKPTPEETARLESEMAVQDPDVAVSTEVESPDAATDESEAEQVATPSAPPEVSSAAAPIEPATPELALTPIDSTAQEPEASYPKRQHENHGATVFTIHVYSGNAPVSQAMVYMGERSTGNLKIGCQTNDRGRCVVRFPTSPTEPVNFVAKRVGFETKSQAIRVTHQGQLRFDLRRGEAIDIFAIKRTYNFATGIDGVEVFIDGRKAGVTDRFGHFSHTYTGKKADLVEVSLRSPQNLPEKFETDFIVSGPMNLVRHFTPVEPPPVRMTLLKVQPAGDIDLTKVKAFDGALDQLLQRSARSSLFATSAFHEFPLSAFNNAAAEAGRNLSEMIRQGWYTTDIKGSVDAVLLPTLVGGRQLAIELSVIDSRGQVLAAAKETIGNVQDAASVNQVMATLVDKITRIFPFEGAVLGRDDSSISLNMGFAHGRGLQVGDELEVYGIQSDKLGREQVHNRIATLKITEIQDRQSKASIVSQAPRTIISRGDLVVLRTRDFEESKAVQIRVVGNLPGGRTESVEQANLYFNERWIGATDQQGRIFVDPELAKSSGILRVIKHGYRDFAQEFKVAGQQRVQVNLIRESAFLRIDSQPSNAEVFVEGDSVGRTPISAPLPVPAGFVRVEIKGPPGYKTSSRILELERGTLDLTGANTVVLEVDYRTAAQRLLSSGDFQGAIARLNQIPPEHSDYLLAQHEIGDTYLMKLNSPARAAEAFGRVTADPAVKQFNDKRFIGSHINEGVALFLTAEGLLGTEPAAARAHYLKAIEVFDRVAPHIRFVPAAQADQAKHNLAFYRALSFHKMWNQTQDKIYLDQAFRHWRDYVDGSGQNLEVNELSKPFVENAEVYLRQAQASLDTMETGISAN